MKLVIVESPFAGKSKCKVIRYIQMCLNIQYARNCMHDCIKRNEAPFASHLLYTQKHILDDNNTEERQLGIKAGLLWGQKADKTVVYTDRGISKGMQYGIDEAIKCNRTIEYRTLSS